MTKYRFYERSAIDSIGRFNGLVKKGIYHGETKLTSRLISTIEKKHPNLKIMIS